MARRARESGGGARAGADRRVEGGARRRQPAPARLHDDHDSERPRGARDHPADRAAAVAMSPAALAFNGIDGATGAYLYEELALDDLERRLGPPDAAVHAGQPHFGVVHGVEPESLAEAGWGVVVPDGTPKEVLQALAPLLGLRRDEAGGLFYELGLARGTSKQDFLAARSMGPGRANPA